MAVTTVAQFAAQLNRPAAALLEQLQSAGVSKKSPEDALTEADKERLLEFLRTAHGTSAAGERKKITLTRKSTSEIKQADASGKARTIQVEVRKKRVFVKRDDASPAVEEPAGPSAEELRPAAPRGRSARPGRSHPPAGSRAGRAAPPARRARARCQGSGRSRCATAAAEAAAKAEARGCCQGRRRSQGRCRCEAAADRQGR